MKYIYLITSPSGKQYVGQSKIPVERKLKSYLKLEYAKKSRRKIVFAIQKYKWSNMKFSVLEENENWTKEQLSEREIYWIAYLNTFSNGYNMTPGGEGVESKCARQNALNHHRTMTIEKKLERKKNCSNGQRKRYKNNPDTPITKQKKSDAHKGRYRIESPDGNVWVTDQGLKDFAEKYKDELKITYWQLFNAYRKCYNNIETVKEYKNSNKWKVIRLNESDS